MDEAQIVEIVQAVRPYTMIPDQALRLTISSAVEVIAQGVDGVLMECGTWKGGSSMPRLLAQRVAFGRVERPVYLLDSFEGLPPATGRDGPLANAYQRQEVLKEWYFDNCSARQDEVEAGLAKLGFKPGEYSIVPGWFEQTLPAVVQRLSTSSIALLRIDCDWYDPVKLCYEQLEPLVAEFDWVVPITIN